MKKKWKHLGTVEKYRDNVVKVEHREYHFDRAASSMPFTVVRMRNWVSIIPVTESGDFVLVRQFRVGTDAETIEFPGGAVETGEPADAAAARELEEETGYISNDIQIIGTMRPNPAFMDNKCYVAVAKNARPTGTLSPDMFEDARPEVYSREKLTELIRTGGIDHSIVLGSWALFVEYYNS